MALSSPTPQVDAERPESAHAASFPPHTPIGPAQSPVIVRKQPQQRGIAGLAADRGKASAGRSSGVTFRAGILIPARPAKAASHAAANPAASARRRRR